MKEKNKIILFVSVIIVLLASLFLYGVPVKNEDQEINRVERTDLSPVQTENVLLANEVLYDFGVISMKNGDVSKTFKVVNSADEDITLPSLTTSCMCTSAFFIGSDGNKSGPFGMPGMGFVPKLNKIIKAGESADVEVVYNPNAHGPAGVGIIDRFVYLESSTGEKLQFEIKANVTP